MKNKTVEASYQEVMIYGLRDIRMKFKGKWINRIIWCLFFLVMGSYVASCIWAQKYLYGDGAMGSFRLFTEGTFGIYPFGRRNFDIISQMFALVGYRLGCRDFSVLGILYSFGLTGMTAVFSGITLFAAQKRGRTEVGLAACIIVTIQIIFTGHYVIVESLFGMTVFLQEAVLYTIHKDDKNKLAVFEYILIGFDLFFTIHLMEFYCAWAPVLVIILLYRIFLCKEAENKLHFAWILAAIWQSYVAIQSFVDIGMRGEAPGADFLFSDILERTYYMQMCGGLGLLALLILLWAIFPGIRKVGAVLLALMGIAIWIRMLCLVYFDTDMVVVNSSALRWSNIPWGMLGGLFMLILLIAEPGTKDQKNLLKIGYCALFLILCTSAVIYEKRSGERQRDYHEQIVAYCDVAYPNTGFVDINYTDFRKEPLLNYSNSWVTSYQCVDLFAMQKKKEITTILINPGKGDEMYEVDAYKGINQFGLYLNLPESDQ